MASFLVGWSSFLALFDGLEVFYASWTDPEEVHALRIEMQRADPSKVVSNIITHWTAESVHYGSFTRRSREIVKIQYAVWEYMVSTVTAYDRMWKKIELVTHEYDWKLHETKSNKVLQNVTKHIQMTHYSSTVLLHKMWQESDKNITKIWKTWKT